ncbi:hypothetical protein B566_EDAN003091 [Ephemera danica]|nr:hypothetical protein B566_EDAN003091 [Ephemera danica]
MATSSAMRLLEERHVAIVVESLVWSNKMDLLALSNVRGEVSLHRLTWQKVWSLPPPKEAVTVTAMAWRPDGKVLAVSYSSQDILLIDVENAEVLHSTKLGHDVSCLAWVDETEKPNRKSSDFIIHYEEKGKTFLPKLPSLSRSFGPMNKGSEENAEDSKKVGDQARLNLLLIGTKDGYIMLKAFGLFPCGCIDVKEYVNDQPCTVLSVDISRNLDVLIGVVACTGSGDSPTYNLGVILIDTPVLESHSRELKYLATQHGYIISLLSYMSQTMESVTEAWENILMEMDSKLSSYASKVTEGSVSADFLDLLMLGTPSEELQTFLCQDLTEKGLKKLGHSIELSYSNIQKLVLKHLQAVGQNIVYHLAELKGMAHCLEHFSSLGLNESLVMSATIAASAFMTKATEVQQVIDSSMKNYKAFFRWLYVAILRISDERVPPEITKIRQQDLTFIAEFLENFDGMGSKCEEGETPTSQKSRFTLERLGQYLVDEDLKITVDASSSPWKCFLENESSVINHPSIIPRFEKMSLVQQHNYLKTAIDTMFKDPETTIKSHFKLIRAVPVYKLQDLSHLKVSSVVNSQEQSVLLSFLYSEMSCEDFYHLKIPLRVEGKVPEYKCAKFKFPSKDEAAHKILDLQFFTEETLSILLEQRQENRTAVFVQFPNKIASEHSSIHIEGASLCDNVETLDAVSLLEPNTLRPMENMVASIFAVSGSRKVSVVLSESRRRVRLFEMEVEEEEEDEDAMDATNTTKDSDVSQPGDVSTSTGHSVSCETQTNITMQDIAEASTCDLENSSPSSP